MAARGGNDGTFAGGVENRSDAIRRAGEKLIEYVTSQNIGFVNVIGCSGIGRWRIIEYAARKLKGSCLFDVQILIKLPNNDLSLARVQMEIMNQLHLTVNVSPEDDETKFTISAGEICKSLLGRRFLLIVGNVTSGIHVQSMGIPQRRGGPYDSKVVFVGDNVVQPLVGLANNVNIDPEELSVDMLCEEASDVAYSPSVEGFFTPEAVLHCCLYLWVFVDLVFELEWVTRNWMAAGIMTEKHYKEEDSMLVEKNHALLRELELRSLLQFDENMKGWVAPHWVSEIDPCRCPAIAWTNDKYWIDSPPKKKLLATYWSTESPPNLPNLSTLQLGRLDFSYPPLEIVLPEPFFEGMPGLRVLQIHKLLIKSLPTNISCLHNLRLLRIYSCNWFKSLPPSFQGLHKLEFLEVIKSSSFETMPDECFLQMANLRFLLLDGTNIRSLPSSATKLFALRQLVLINCPSLIEIPNEIFDCMQQLRVLDLSGDFNLKSLPSLLSKLVNLRRLMLSNCHSLKMKLLPHLQKLSTLEELNLCNCNSVEDIEDVSSSLGNILPKLRNLDLSGIVAIQRVSLIGCQSLESVSLNGVTSLQVLSLSSTKIKSFPENMSHTGHLKHLDMLGMNNIHEIKWDALGTEIEYLNIDQCGTLNSLDGARIRVSNHHLLLSLTPSSTLLSEKCFSRFHICISPCNEEERQRQFVYANICSKTQRCSLSPASHFDRHLEIQGGDSSPNSICGVLSRMELLTLCDNAFVQRLSDLGNVDYIAEMKECRIKRCKGMQILFEGVNLSSYALSLLEKIWISNLAILRSVCEGTYGRQSFALLKHIYLECCPRLVVVFSSGVCLPSLEILQIEFCSRLKAVFRGEATEKDSLQRLHTVCLWELPKLESICSYVCLPALKKLRVSGCPKLNKLPFPIAPENAADASGEGDVEVEGDLVWWTSVKLKRDSITRHVRFKERRPFIRC